MSNFENGDTDYRIGTVFHLGWTVAKHFANGVAAWLSGYWLQQLDSDKGKVVAPTNYSSIKPYGFGIGPSVQANIPLENGKALGVIGRTLFDIDSKDRFTGNMFMLSAAYKF